MRFASGIHSEHAPFAASIQRALRLFGYHLERARSSGSRRNPEETKMSLHETMPDAASRGRRDQKAEAAAPKRKRPLTAAQEAVFFGVTFALAVVLQLAVILKVANVISW
jgi:hypothetical protein